MSLAYSRKSLYLSSFYEESFEVMGRRMFVIQFGGLAVGTHEFEIEMDNKFFEEVQHEELLGGNVSAKIELTKQNNLLSLIFNLKGKVEILCDRCAKQVPLPIEITEKLVVKNGDVSETTDEIFVLPPGETEIDVSQLLYEFILLSLPIKRVPCELDESVVCDFEALEKLEEIETEEKKEDTETNPIWEKLKNIKVNKN
ncbi:MAG: YceD family protein [Bacteroidota bacterium]